MTDSRLSAVLAETGPVLLDFDGPVTHLFVDGRNRLVADRMRQALGADSQPPPEVWDTHDPLVVLRWSASHTSAHTQRAVEHASVLGEVEAAKVTEPTPGSEELLLACRDAGRAVVIVSNNAEQAIRTYLDRFDLTGLVQSVIARTAGRPDLMKPHPDSIERALRVLEASPSECCMVGDSITDITVCKATGVRSIGYAKNPRRGQELADAGADALVDSMTDLAVAIASPDRSPVSEQDPVERFADWSPWVPFDEGSRSAPRSPGVYMARLGAHGSVIYVGMAGERRGQGIRGRLTVYRRGRGAVSGLGEAALDRALNDPAWVRDQLASVEAGRPTRTRTWATEALQRADLRVRWAATVDQTTARQLERQILDALREADLWNRIR